MIVVPVTSVIDGDVLNQSVSLESLKRLLNPLDQSALAMAMQSGFVHPKHTVEVVHVGREETLLRSALALGGQGATLIESSCDQPIQIAQVLAEWIKQQASVEAVIMGQYGADYASGQVGPMLAGLLDWPQATAVIHLEGSNSQQYCAHQLTDQGVQPVELTVPYVITTALSSKALPHPTVVDIIRSQSELIKRYIPNEASPPIQINEREIHRSSHRKCIKVHSADELIKALARASML